MKLAVVSQVLGREVYSSNTQLGGIQIMYNNGVTHLTVPTDVEGVATILDWLAYIPKVWLVNTTPSPEGESSLVSRAPQVKGGPLPVVPSLDPVTRPVEYMPTKAPYDPKLLIEGQSGSGRCFPSNCHDNITRATVPYRGCEVERWIL